MPNERAIKFECSGDTCVGIIHEGDEASRVGMLVIVGGPQYRVGSHRQFVHLARHVAGAGYPVFRFDYRGMGDSTGEQRDFRGVSPDIHSAIDAFKSSVPGLKSVVIFGLCDAASAALMYVASDDRVGGLILANPWVRTESGLARVHVRHYYLGRLAQGSFWRKLRSGRFELLKSVQGLIRTLKIALRGRESAPAQGSDINFIDAMRVGFENFACPVLILISGRDLTAREFMNLCADRPEWGRLLEANNVEMLSNGDADHTFSTRASSEWVSAACLEWLRRGAAGS